MKPGVSAAELSAAISAGSILTLTQTVDVSAGDTVFMPPGTIHALGPGLLIYEVQQCSDLTYRVYDWDRPQTEKRKLHIEKSLAVANPQATAPAAHLSALADGERRLLTQCPYFTLEVLGGQSRSLALDTSGQTFHALTVIEGAAQVLTAQGVWALGRFETLLIPAACGVYEITPVGSFTALKASVELD
jgi:mannose-6-phosphate isomerase